MALCGMLVYCAAVTIYLICAGLVSGISGTLLPPVIVVHLILTALLTRALISGTEART